MSKPLRVLQVIDSLDPGGSEKMAVQIANVLSTKIELSALVCTRQSGNLEDEISDQVLFCSLQKSSAIDLKAFLRLRSFIKLNRIGVLHAHSSSFFWSTLLKLFNPKLKLIWHDHYGYRSKTSKINNFILSIFSFAFNQIITVNKDLKNWAIKNLNCKSVYYLPNFVSGEFKRDVSSLLKLKGPTDAFKIIHVANLRPQKDHLTALKAVSILKKQDLNISYHVLGQYNSESEYFSSLKSYIKSNDLKEIVFIYGSQTNISEILKQANTGILSSISEGLPVSLLEYAKAELPVIVTDVGQCKAIVGKYGKVVEPDNEIKLASAIVKTIAHEDDAKQKAKQLRPIITQKFNPVKITEQLIDIYNLSLQISK